MRRQGGRGHLLRQDRHNTAAAADKSGGMGQTPYILNRRSDKSGMYAKGNTCAESFNKALAAV